MSDDDYELDVQLRFAVPVTADLDLDPGEMAAYMRERWLSDEQELHGLIKVLTQAALDQDVDVVVRPAFTS